MLQTISRKSLKVSCNSSPKYSANNKQFYKRVQEKVNDFGKKRTSVAKENFNKLVSASQQDVKELTDLFKELDTMHRAQFDELKETFMQNNKKGDTKKCSCKKGDEAEDTEVALVTTEDKDTKKDDDNEKTEDNIFIDV